MVCFYALTLLAFVSSISYEAFGKGILQDENGEKVDLIKKNNRQEGAEGITQVLLQEWLRDGPEHTRTYDHLMECLRESGLGTLADDIVR